MQPCRRRSQRRSRQPSEKSGSFSLSPELPLRAHGQSPGLITTLPRVYAACSFLHSEFVLARYNSIKQHNPDLPVLIREAEGTPARAFARFGLLIRFTVLLPLLTPCYPARTWCGKARRAGEPHCQGCRRQSSTATHTIIENSLFYFSMHISTSNCDFLGEACPETNPCCQLHLVTPRTCLTDTSTQILRPSPKCYLYNNKNRHDALSMS